MSQRNSKKATRANNTPLGPNAKGTTRNQGLSRAQVKQMINSYLTNAFSAQTTGLQTRSNVLRPCESIKGKVRVLTLTNDSDPQLFYMDFDGFLRAGCPIITSIMQNYERWRLRKAMFHFVPYVDKTTSGSISIAPDFDVLDAPVTTSEELSVSDQYKSGSISNPLTVDGTNPLVMTPLDDVKFVAPAGQARQASAGFLNVLVDTAYVGSVGYIDFEYEIDLFIKTPQPVDSGSSSSDRTLTSQVGATTADRIMAVDYVDIRAPYLVLDQDIGYGQTLSGIIDYTDGQYTITTQSGKPIPPGTRVYIRTPTTYCDSSGADWINYVGGIVDSIASYIALDKGFLSPLRFAWDAADRVLTLTDTRYWE